MTLWLGKREKHLIVRSLKHNILKTSTIFGGVVVMLSMLFLGGGRGVKEGTLFTLKIRLNK